MSRKTVPIGPSAGISTLRGDVNDRRTRLEQLKISLYPPEKRPEQLANSLAALRSLGLDYSLDVKAWKYVAQHADLEGF